MLIISSALLKCPSPSYPIPGSLPLQQLTYHFEICLQNVQVTLSFPVIQLNTCVPTILSPFSTLRFLRNLLCITEEVQSFIYFAYFISQALIVTFKD